jgi:diadenosine tetraphosphate (Ap4A) HIT family hydrolase
MAFSLDKRLKNDSVYLGSFALCELLLINDCQYPWYVLVPRKVNTVEIYQLSESEQAQLWLESRVLSVAIMNIHHGKKLNIAAIGNLVEQLHLHHVVRFENDACWPKPVWGQLEMKAYPAADIAEIGNKIMDELTSFDFCVR